MLRINNAIINRVRTWYYVIKYQHVLRKARFGKNPHISCRLSIQGPGRIRIGDDCRIEPDPWGDDYVTLYTHRKEARITVGKGVLMRATRFGCHLAITIGNNAVLENASIFDSDFHNTDALKRDEGFNANDKKVVIGEGAYVGCESLCSKGTELGRNVVMVAVSVIGTKSIPDDTKIGGFPARMIS